MFTDENSEDQVEVTACMHSSGKHHPRQHDTLVMGMEPRALTNPALPTPEHEQEGLGQAQGQLWEEMRDTQRNTCKLKDPQNLEGEEHAEHWI